MSDNVYLTSLQSSKAFKLTALAILFYMPINRLVLLLLLPLLLLLVLFLLNMLIKMTTT